MYIHLGIGSFKELDYFLNQKNPPQEFYAGISKIPSHVEGAPNFEDESEIIKAASIARSEKRKFFFVANEITSSNDSTIETIKILNENSIDGFIIKDLTLLKKLKEIEKVDFIAINFHWGKEGSNYANKEQQKIARLAIDNGANIVIGHHPHVLQGIENYKNGFIAYSLGNFIFGGNSRKHHYTALAKIKIQNGKIISEVIPIEVRNFCAFELPTAKKDSIINLIGKYSNYEK